MKKENSNVELSPALYSEFVDSTNIGIKGQSKLELRQFSGIDSCNLKILFSVRDNSNWREIQRFEFDMSLILDLENVMVQDYNNDGFKDFTYHSFVPARGGNEVRKLFLYSPDKNELIYIRNSEEYPNLSYNKELDCLDAFGLYGGSSTYFLNIESDTLREFARIDLWDNHRTVLTIDKYGEEKIIGEDTVTEGPYIRYKNYKTLEEYTDD